MSDDVGSVTSPRVLANLSLREVTYPPLPPNARPAPGRTTDDRKDTDTVMTIHVSLTFPVDQLIETADERLDARADSRRSVGRDVVHYPLSKAVVVVVHAGDNGLVEAQCAEQLVVGGKEHPTHKGAVPRLR